MVIYSDNTNVPKFRVWNGSSWSGQISTRGIGGVPVYISARARPGTREIMASFFDQGSDANTQYFDGGRYRQGNWTLHAEHSAVAPVNTKRLIDFAWSPADPTVGALVFSNSGTDLSLNIKIWRANGAGGGAWSGTENASNQISQLGAMAIAGRPEAGEFIACDKDANAAPNIICYKSTFAPAWTNPSNQIIVAGTDAGIQKSYDIAFEPLDGSTAIAVYSDLTAIPKLKKYDGEANSWDGAPTSFPALGGALEAVRLVPNPDQNDLMVLLSDTNQDLYGVVWNGDADTLYAPPSGKSFTAHGTNGSADGDFWFDFAWDAFPP